MKTKKPLQISEKKVKKDVDFIRLAVFMLLFIVTVNSAKTKPTQSISDLKHECDVLLKKQDEFRLNDNECADLKFFCGIQSCSPELKDVVYMWVNGSETDFKNKLWTARREIFNEQKDRELYEKDEERGVLPTKLVTIKEQKQLVRRDEDSLSRFRDLDQLRYSLRSLEKYFPFCRRIFILTDNQVPDWLNTDHLMIRMVSHDILNRPYIPENRDIPKALFDSSAIQTMIHTIPGLSSPFLYMDDDVFFNSKIDRDTVFSSNLPILNIGQAALLKPEKANMYNEMVLKSKALAEKSGANLDSFIKKDFLFFNAHVGLWLYPSVLNGLWDKLPQEMFNLSVSVFRSGNNPALWPLYTFLAPKEKYHFVESQLHGFYSLKETTFQSAFKELKAHKGKVPFVCLNDDFMGGIDGQTLKFINEGYQYLLPDKSFFEID